MNNPSLAIPADYGVWFIDLKSRIQGAPDSRERYWRPTTSKYASTTTSGKTY